MLRVWSAECQAALRLAPRLLFRAFLEESSHFQLVEGLPKLLLRVHHNGTVPGDGLFQRLAGNEQETDAVFACLNFYFIAAIKKNERAVIEIGRASCRERV